MLSGANRKIILEDGSEYAGCAFGADGEKLVEIVFNTSMVGYQEILSDPSYTDQAVVMTYPLIGNYGMADDDYETHTPTIGALIVRQYNDEPSNFRSTKTLGEVMRTYGIAGVSGIDTRTLARHIRNFGSCKALLTDIGTPTEEGLRRLRAGDIPRDAVSRVSRKAICRYAGANARFHVVAVDCGMKQNIVRSLQKKGCDVTVVPWNTDAETIASLQPDGVFLSNGPGDPTDVPEV
ncbi:MAG: carbamoyl phosphate synthase small subunit, partial [Clostridia bacterium]|nr:carbamoyl phosphate synthase small subunit [Clostridia bacterium]